ncbi:Uncharacterized protein OBRU01_08133, partial [Operophtera brumata]
MMYSPAVTVRRIDVLIRIISGRKAILGVNNVRAYSSEDKVTIGDVTKEISSPKNAEYVPRKYLMVENKDLSLSQSTLRNLRWMMQKDILGQDMFLLGRPGPSRRKVALQYLELTQRELEYSAVRAATEGRVLVLEGIEKAERNVLPVLNNLLENREMHLEDGRFLIPAARYDKLLDEHGAEEVAKWRLVRVDDRFRVIALGLPVPRYSGQPLDPPLRSRFQARDVATVGYPVTHVLTGIDKMAASESGRQVSRDCARAARAAVLRTAARPAAQEQVPGQRCRHCRLLALKEEAPRVDRVKLEQVLSAAYALISPELQQERNPGIPIHKLLYLLYPYNTLLTRENIKNVEAVLSNLKIDTDPKFDIALHGVYFKENQALVNMEINGVKSQFGVPCGTSKRGVEAKGIVKTDYQSQLLNELLLSHSVGDFCIVGPKGCGKSLLITQLSSLLGYTIEPIVLYQDMTARDLVQQRTTLDNGDTVWRNSALVDAALKGHMAYGEISQPLHSIINLAGELRNSQDSTLKNLSSSLSTRQLLRIANRMSKYPTDSAYETIQRTFLAKFLPNLARRALDGASKKINIDAPTQFGLFGRGEKKVNSSVKNNVLTIGDTSTEIFKTEALTKVPDILFYDVPQHMRLLEWLLQDFLLGNHLLLVGNQGVGKNKIADRLLQLLNRPREYIQLHRDTTVQSLTVQPTVKDGIVVYEDSPLVKAVKFGHVLVVDEADKAPTHVTCILKTLVENGEMILSDGRRIVPKDMMESSGGEVASFIPVHDDFRMILELLRSYGPDVPHDIMKKLVQAFALLREKADQGQLTKDMADMLLEVLHASGLPTEGVLAGRAKQEKIQMTIERDNDPDNKPHVGGNTWAGGTGGRDTAGLDAEKDDIPDHVKKAAKEMNRKAFEERLKEIKMSEYDAKLYEQFYRAVQPQELYEECSLSCKLRRRRGTGVDIRQAVNWTTGKLLKVRYRSDRRACDIPQAYGATAAAGLAAGQGQATQARLRCIWKYYRSDGRACDIPQAHGATAAAGRAAGQAQATQARLRCIWKYIQRAIYRRRTEQEPPPGAPPDKPKQLRLVLDVRYRSDGRACDIPPPHGARAAAGRAAGQAQATQARLRYIWKYVQ